MKWHLFVFEVPETLKSVSTFLYEKEKAKIRQQCEEATGEIVKILRAEALEYINGLISKLTPSPDGSSKRLHESYMERLRDFFDVFEARNIANDQQLSEAIQIARKAIAGATVEELRDDEA